MRLSQLLGLPVATESGRRLGRVHDVRGRIVGGRLLVTGLIAGPPGALERLGIGADANDRPRDAKMHAHAVIPWERVLGVGSEILVRD